MSVAVYVSVYVSVSICNSYDLVKHKPTFMNTNMSRCSCLILLVFPSALCMLDVPRAALIMLSQEREGGWGESRYKWKLVCARRNTKSTFLFL